MARRLMSLVLAPSMACSVAEPTSIPEQPPAASSADRVAVQPASHQRGLDVPEWQTVAHSVEGRGIEARTAGTGPRLVLWIGGIHGDALEGRHAAEQLSEAFSRTGELPRTNRLTVIRCLNPDGAAHGWRANARGVDLAYDFPTQGVREPRRPGEPESKFLHDLILRDGPDLVLLSTAGPSGARTGRVRVSGPMPRLGRVFTGQSDYRIDTQATRRALPGSFRNWVSRDMETTILVLEHPRGADAVRVWAGIRDAILAVIRG